MSSGFGVLRVLLRALLVLLLHLRGVAPVGFWSQEGTSNTGTEKALKEVPRHGLNDAGSFLAICQKAWRAGGAGPCRATADTSEPTRLGLKILT